MRLIFNGALLLFVLSGIVLRAQNLNYLHEFECIYRRE